MALSGILSTSALAVVTASGALTYHGNPSWLTLTGLTATILLITVGIHRTTRHPERLPALARGRGRRGSVCPCIRTGR